LRQLHFVLSAKQTMNAIAQHRALANEKTALALWPVHYLPRNPKKPVFDFRAHFCHSAPWKRTLSASDSGRTPRRAKGNFLARILPD
jgi:proline dehydrogenase